MNPSTDAITISSETRDTCLGVISMINVSPDAPGAVATLTRLVSARQELLAALPGNAGP